MKLIEHHESNLVTYSLYEVMHKIYAVQVKDDYERGMLFLRAQEYYESPFNDMRGRNFDIFEYMNKYRSHRGADAFTYPRDWCGYNIPSNELEYCLNQLDREVDCVTPYDDLMMHIVWQIRQVQKRGNFYLIGLDDLKSSTMEHEFAHALFFTDKEYKKEMLDLILSLPSNLHDSLTGILLQMGYPQKTVADEIQAFLSTGISDHMYSCRGVKTWAKKFSKTFKKYYGKQKSNNGRTKRETTATV